MSAAPRLSKLKPGRDFASKAEYEKPREKLQKRLLSIQQAYYHSKRRAVLVFEGWDAAGKGGAIRRLFILTVSFTTISFPSLYGRVLLYSVWE